jgi:hypothetical protein
MTGYGYGMTPGLVSPESRISSSNTPALILIMAGVYNINIPASAPLANATANNHVAVAAAIHAGQVRTLADVAEAREETMSRKRLKSVNDNAVTADEISLSSLREVAVLGEGAAGLYGAPVVAPGAAPAWALPLLALPGQVAALTNQVAALTNQLNALAGQVNAMDARQRCQTAQRYNRVNCEDRAFRQLVKVNAGIGPPLPGRAAQIILADPVGTLYPVAQAFVPDTLAALNQMSASEISALAEWANEDFGIQAGDSLAVCRSQVFQHYSTDI